MRRVYAVLLAVMVACLAFHYAYCLVPSMRYFGARRAAYALGAVAYLIVCVPPLADAFLATDIAAKPAYFIAAAAVLTIVAWRPFAFVRATGGPRQADPN